MSLDRPFVLSKKFDLGESVDTDFDVMVIPDKDMTHSCSNYTNDSSTVFTRDGNLVLKVSSACEDGRCLNSGRVMSKQGFRYGVFVFKAKVPKCNFVWPAIWLLPNNSAGAGEYGTWPCSGEIDVLETVHDQKWGAFNLVAGFGADENSAGGTCANAKTPQCNRCGAPAYCTSTTLENMLDSFYYVEDTDCNAEHPSWSEHTFVLNWQPNKLATWVDPELKFDANGRLEDIQPGSGPEKLYVWDKHIDMPTWKAYERTSTPTWERVGTFMDQCSQTAGEDAPFDKDFKIVFNIAVGGYGGSPCTWGTDSCTTTCAGAIGSELVISEVLVYERP